MKRRPNLIDRVRAVIADIGIPLAEYKGWGVWSNGVSLDVTAHRPQKVLVCRHGGSAGDGSTWGKTVTALERAGLNIQELGCSALWVHAASGDSSTEGGK